MHPVTSFLKTHGIRLNTDLGQHFLIDDDVLQAIVASAGIEPEDHIVEIGPGIGVLTKELLKHAGKVTAIEIDPRMISLVKKFVKEFVGQEYSCPTNSLTNFSLIQGNALHIPLPEHPYKIVANIPYHITSPLLRHAFLESKRIPTSMTLLIQREVAEKICDTENTGILTILVALFGTPSLIMTVPPSAFLPPPEVDSAVLHIESHSKPLADSETVDRILKLIKIAFGQKRKMLSNTLGKIPGGAEALTKLQIDPNRRPQTLTVQEWIAVGALMRP